MQITVSTISKEQKPHPHIDNFYGPCFILKTKKLFLLKIPQFCQIKLTMKGLTEK